MAVSPGSRSPIRKFSSRQTLLLLLGVEYVVLSHSRSPSAAIGPLLDLGHNIAVKETLALVNVLEAFSRSVQDHRVDVFTDSQALIWS